MTLGSKFRRRGRFARQNREQVAIGPVKGTSGGHRTVEAVSAQFSRGGALLPGWRWDHFVSSNHGSVVYLSWSQKDSRVTPRERKDMPWLLMGLAIVIIVIVASAISEWLS